MTRGAQAASGGASRPAVDFDRDLLAPRALVFLLLAAAHLVEPGGLGSGHWLALSGYLVATLALALRRRGRPLSRRLGWAATVLDAALALFLIGEHGAALRAGAASSPGADLVSQLPAFLFLLQSGLTLDPRRTVVMAGLVVAGWCGLLIAASGSAAELGYQAYGLLAFATASLFVADGVWRLRASVDGQMRLEIERARLARFMPAQAAGQAGPGGTGEVRHRHAAMLAVDVRGFSALTREHGAAAVVPWLLEARALVHQAVTHHGGFVDKYLGDGVLSHFLDGSAEAQADAALGAAVELTGRIEAWNDGRGRAGLPPMRVTVALHAGEVLAGVFDDGLRSEFTVLGPAMNALSRIERRAKDDGLDLVASKRFARLLPASARQGISVSRLPRRDEDRDAPDVVRLVGDACARTSPEWAAATA